MAKEAAIRKNRPGKWRGYLRGVRVIEFEDTATESAETAARRWLEASSNPEKPKPAKPEPAKPAAPKLFEHVKINYADVAQQGLQLHQNFLAIYWEMQESFGDRDFGRRVCIHEAAHAYFMEKSGIPNVKFYGPAIVVNNVTQKFQPIGAMVRGDDTPNKVVDEAWVREVAKHAAAGGRALVQYENVSEAGDEKDFADFKLRCAGLPPFMRHLSPRELWDDASEQVDKELRNATVKATILARAEEYFRCLYPSG